MTKVVEIRVQRRISGAIVAYCDVAGRKKFKPVPVGASLKGMYSFITQKTARYKGVFYVSKKPVPTSSQDYVVEKEVFDRTWRKGIQAEGHVSWTVNYPPGRYYIGMVILESGMPVHRLYVEHDVVEKAAPPPPPPPAAYVTFNVEAPPLEWYYSPRLEYGKDPAVYVRKEFMRAYLCRTLALESCVEPTSYDVVEEKELYVKGYRKLYKVRVYVPENYRGAILHVKFTITTKKGRTLTFEHKYYGRVEAPPTPPPTPPTPPTPPPKKPPAKLPWLLLLGVSTGLLGLAWLAKRRKKR